MRQSQSHVISLRMSAAFNDKSVCSDFIVKIITENQHN